MLLAIYGRRQAKRKALRDRSFYRFLIVPVISSSTLKNLNWNEIPAASERRNMKESLKKALQELLSAQYDLLDAMDKANDADKAQISPIYIRAKALLLDADSLTLTRKIIGYLYDKETHCPACAAKAGMDKDDSFGSNGWPVLPLYAGDGIDGPIHCKDCGRVIDAR